MEISKEQIRSILITRIPFAIINSKGKMKYPFISSEASEQVVNALVNGIHEELIKLRQTIGVSAVCENPHCEDGVTMELHGEKYYCHICRDKKQLVDYSFKELAEWLLINKRSVFMDADIPKQSKRKIMNDLGYSSNSLDD